MKPTIAQKAVFMLVEECGHPQSLVATTLKISNQRVSELLTAAMKKYAAARAACPGVPECQFRRQFLAA